MGSRERERDREHPTHQVSSMVVRPAENGSGGSDYESGEVLHGENHKGSAFYTRSDRFRNNQHQGYGMRAGSVSPIRQRKVDRYYGSDFNHRGGPRRGRGFRGGGRGSGTFRDISPPFYGRGRGSRSYGREFDDLHAPSRGDGIFKNNPNVSPREGDWICSEPACGNLNFARRSQCNNCNKFRVGSGGSELVLSPRRRYPGPSSPRGPMTRIHGPPLLDRGPQRDMRDMNGYGSPPPRSWGRDGMGPPPLRQVGRFSDSHFPRERPGYQEEEYRERGGKFDRPVPPDWTPPRQDRGRDDFVHDRRGYHGRGERSPLSPLTVPPPSRGQWAHDIRERSRSPPLRGPLKDFRRDEFVGRGRDDRRGIRRERISSGSF